MTMTKHRGHINNSGGPNAPRKPNGNIDWNIVRDNYILPLIENQIAPNTTRGIMYILKNQYGVLKKSDTCVLGIHLVQWCKEGIINWEHIADGSGRGVINDFEDYRSPMEYMDDTIDILRNCGDYYRYELEHRWRWYGQPHYVEFWTEKHAVVGTMAAHVKGNFTRVAFNRGNPGWKYMYENCKRLENELYYYDLNLGKKMPRFHHDSEESGVHVFYLGDNDKYGKDMDQEIREKLKHFGLLNFIDFKRIAITEDQIEEYGLHNDDGSLHFEIDVLNAVNQEKFKQLLLDHITPYFREDIHRQLLEKYPVKDINKMISKKVRFLI
jgi:hypothetical protein